MDVFKLLSGGTQFNKKRFHEDLDLFKSKKPAAAPIVNDKITAFDLDFFKSNDAPAIDDTNEPSKKKSKISSNVKSDIIVQEAEAPMTKEEASIFRKDKKIKVYGKDIPHPFKSFNDLFTRFKFKAFIKRNILELGYDSPTPIQMQAIPIMLHGRELMACAPTGSGKTLAFLLPILHSLKGPTKQGFRAVIISPTRELAQQIHRELLKLSVSKPFKVCMLTKATNVTSHQITESLQTFDILISTPLRLVHALKEENIKLDNVCHLVFDEADKLLELGFLDQVDDILAACTNNLLHKALFSATIPSGVETLANSFMKDPIRVVIGQKNAATETISQKLLYVGQEEGKLLAVRQLVQQGLKPPVLIFCQSIDRAKELFHELVYDGINVDVIHSERTKAQRDCIISSFRSGKVWVLITTELMARGIDFKGVNLVINYDFPQTIASYIHRIGRTGRAGRKGEAVTFFTKDDAPYLKTIVNVMKESGCEVPEWMINLKNPTKNEKKKLKQKPIERANIKTTSKYDENKIRHKRELIMDSKKKMSGIKDQK